MTGRGLAGRERWRAAALARGPCPDNETLIDFAERRLAGAEAARVETHLALCATCSLLVERLRAPPEELDALARARSERNLDRRPAPWRRRGVQGWAAAAAVAALAVTLWVLRPVGEAPPVLRGDALVLTAPLGDVAAIERFRWQTSPAWTRYRIEVEGRRGAWQGEAVAPPLLPPAELAAMLEDGQSLRWRVLALDADGAVLAASAWADVRLRRGD